MGAISGLDDYVNRVTGGASGNPESVWFFDNNTQNGVAAAATVAGRMSSLWTYDGVPSGGVVPTSVVAPDSTTPGALKQTNAPGGAQKWMIGATVTANVAGTLILYDRLLHIGGLSGTVTTAQTVGGALTRNTGGVGNQIWVEIYTAIGSTATTVTASYTNQGGTSGRTSQATAIGGTGLAEATRIIPLSLAQGDYGVQAVASVTVLATTGTAGNFGITIARPILQIPVGVLGVGWIRDLVLNEPGILPIDTSACLTWAFLASTTTAPIIMGSTHFVDA